jgi:uncharacterized protein
VTAQPILETLAREFSVEVSSIQAVFEMLDAGLSPVFVGRFRRALTGALSEHQVRRLSHMRAEFEELDRRRGTILRQLERQEGVDPAALEQIRRCMDRFELEDLYVPHRRPEPEVQLALDRGLGGLADEIVRAVPKDQRRGHADADEAEAEAGDDEHEAAPHAGGDEGHHDPHAHSPSDGVGHEHAGGGQGGGEQGSGEAVTAEQVAADAGSAEHAQQPDEVAGHHDGGQHEAGHHDESGDDAAHDIGAAAEPHQPTRVAVEDQLAMNAELVRICAPFVDPDKGVHTEAEALAGAVRILSDRLGRNAHLRGLVRRTLRKRGFLTVRSLVDDKKAGRHKPLLRLRAPLRQLQGHKLIALRQAQKERVLTTHVELEPAAVLPKVRAALGRHTRPEFEPLLREISLQALRDRIMPVVEGDIRLELKERSDFEALRFLGAHLRQVLLSPALGRRRVAGVDVNAKGDLSLAFLDENGDVLADARVEVGTKDDAALVAELVPLFDLHQPEALAFAHGKTTRNIVQRIRRALFAAGRYEGVLVVNESGAASYANGQLARAELGDRPVPVRLAITLGRRMQDPLAEILKVDPRHLGLGAEQGLVSKANSRRVFDEAIESCVAYCGAEVDRGHRIVLEHIPGLDKAAAARLIERRAAGPIENREALRAEGILTEAQWLSAIAFLRVYRSTEPLDRTGLHPEQYPLVHRLLEPAGGAHEVLGHMGATKGLRRSEAGVDEYTWRDIMRELTFPGRDPRPRVRVPDFLSPDTDPIRLQPGRVVEGVVTNVASFGAFVDIGLADDAMVHISELAARYVRDAREILSIGATVRARIVDPNGSRMALSLKDVPPPERAPRRPYGEGRQGQSHGGHGEGGGQGHAGPGHGAGGHGGGGRGGQQGRGGEGRGGGRGRGRDEGQHGAAGIAAQVYRRDGAAGAASRGRSFGGPGRGPGGPGGAGGPGGFGRGGKRDDRGERDERVDLRKFNDAAQKAAVNNPFANFFGKQKPAAPASPPPEEAAHAPEVGAEVSPEVSPDAKSE